MVMFLLYTGATKEEAETKAIQNVNQLNTNLQGYTHDDSLYAEAPQELTAEPVINEITYYYGIEKPNMNLMYNVTSDLEAYFDSSWIIQKEM